MSQFFNQKIDDKLTVNYNFDTNAAIVTLDNPATGHQAKAIFRSFRIAHMSYLRMFAEHITDCLEWASLGSDYKTITLDPGATNVSPIKGEIVVL